MSRDIRCHWPLLACFVILGCDREPAETRFTHLTIDLRPCLGAAEGSRDVDAGSGDAGRGDATGPCRATLDLAVARGVVNACLLVRPQVEGAATHRLALRWQDGRLEPALGDGALDLAPGPTLAVALFFLAVADETGALCEQLTIEAPCADDARCVLKLVDADVMTGAAGAEPVRFARAEGGCQAEGGAAFAAGERCDRRDDDCDGIADEDIDCDACDADGCVTCSDPSDCDGIAERPICDEEICRACADDGECERLGGGGECIRGGPDEGACHACDPADNDGCDREGPAPVCDAVAGRCGPCADDAQCNRPAGLADRAPHLAPPPDPPRVCDDGRCVACRSSDHAGCDGAGEQPICAPTEDGPACRGCRDAAECVSLGRGFHGCVEGRCTACDAESHAPCAETAICAGGVCGSCRVDDECRRRDPSRPRCIAGECQPCHPADCACGEPRPECGDLGDPCEADAACTGGICLDDDGSFYCSRPCALGGDDCDAGAVCVSIAGRAVCVPRFVPCTEDDLCPPETACMFARNLPSVPLVCRPERRDGGPVGAPCHSQRECVTGLCIERIARCGRRCASPARCDVGTVCVHLPGEAATAWCVTGCGSDDDCPARVDPPDGIEQELCRFRLDAAQMANLGACDRPNHEGAEVGALCEGGEDCLHGLCRIVEDGDSYCTRPCADGTDCPGGWVCGATELNGLPVEVCLR